MLISRPVFSPELLTLDSLAISNSAIYIMRYTYIMRYKYVCIQVHIYVYIYSNSNQSIFPLYIQKTYLKYVYLCVYMLYTYIYIFFYLYISHNVVHNHEVSKSNFLKFVFENIIIFLQNFLFQTNESPCIQLLRTQINLPQFPLPPHYKSQQTVKSGRRFL